MTKLYVDDKGIHYRTTKVKPLKTKHDIDDILHKYGITDIAWKFDLDNNKVELSFQFSERFQEHELMPIVRLKPPTIWNRDDTINWRVSLRVLHWYIKTNLEMVYSMQSGRILAFLPYIVVDPESTVKDVVVPRLGDLQTFKRLPPPSESSPSSDAQATKLSVAFCPSLMRSGNIATLEFVRQLGREPLEVAA